MNELLWEIHALVAGLTAPPEPVQVKPDNRKKLTTTEVQAIRDLARQGIPYRDIARTFDVHHSTVSRTVKGIYHRKGNQ